MLLKLFAMWLLLFITFPVARLCFAVFHYVDGFLMESKANLAGELKTSTDEKVERLLGIWS
jgi:hypothetical protein